MLQQTEEYMRAARNLQPTPHSYTEISRQHPCCLFQCGTIASLEQRPLKFMIFATTSSYSKGAERQTSQIPRNWMQASHSFNQHLHDKSRKSVPIELGATVRSRNSESVICLRPCETSLQLGPSQMSHHETNQLAGRSAVLVYLYRPLTGVLP